MNKTATQVLQDAIFASVCEAITAFKANAGGMPNVLARDLSAVHPNTAYGDLPEPVQKAIQTATQDALKRLQREGYTLASNNASPHSNALRPRDKPLFAGKRPS